MCTGGALNLLVTAVADQEDVVVVAGEPLGLLVHLRDQRAGGVDGAQLARGRLLVHRRGDPVRTEDDDRALGHLVGLVDEDGPAPLQRGHDVLVVDDLLADVHRSAVDLQRPLDGHHRPIDAGAVAPGVGQQDTSALISHAPMVGGPMRTAAVPEGGTAHGHQPGGSAHIACLAGGCGARCAHGSRNP
jgi:hypothetical protein